MSPGSRPVLRSASSSATLHSTASLRETVPHTRIQPDVTAHRVGKVIMIPIVGRVVIA